MRGSGSKEYTKSPMDSAPTAPRPPFETSDFQTAATMYLRLSTV